MRILILGSKGMLGQQLVKVFGGEAIGWDRSDVDVTQAESLKLKVESLKPDVIINCVAYNDVDGAEDNQGAAFKLNSEVPENLAKICQELDIVLVHFSTNYVFDGEKGEYQESDLPNPLSAYAKSKYQGELKVADNARKFYLIRTAVLFGERGESSQTKKSFVQLMLDLAKDHKAIRAVDDEINNPTSVVDLARAVELLLESGAGYGIYHLVNSGQASWYDIAKEIFEIKAIKVNLTAVSRAGFPRKAQTPKKSLLINTKLPQLRPWQEALSEYMNQEVGIYGRP